MKFLRLLNTAIFGMALASLAFADPNSDPRSTCMSHTNSKTLNACGVVQHLNLASINEDLRTIYGSSGTISVIQPDAILAPALDTSVSELENIKRSLIKHENLKNLRPKLRPDSNTFYASRILNVLDKKGKLDLNECLNVIEPTKQAALFPERVNDITALNALMETPSAWKKFTSGLFTRKHDEGFCIDYLSLLLVKS